MFEKLFESLDEKVFTPELKETLETQFNEAVEAKSKAMLEDMLVEKIDELDEKATDFEAVLKEKYETALEEEKAMLVENLDKYLERVVEEFITESQEKLDESIKQEKADTLIEAFESFIVAAGVDISRIVEAKDESSVSKELEESTTKYDKLIEEVIQLKEENEKLLKMGIISEMKEGLSLVEAEKFEKLANLVDFSKDGSYADKLETIKESVKSSKKEDLQESKEIKEDTKKPAWAHLV